MDTTTLAIIIGVGILLISVAIGVAIGTKARKSGLMSKRSGSFYRETSTFTANTTTAAVLKALGQFDLASHRIQIAGRYEQGALHFSCPGWTAQLVQTGANEFQFDFTHFEARNGIPASMLQMNMLLTSVEKAFLMTDPNAAVVRRAKAMKTKSSIW